jgi:hypothetical protein
MQNKDFVEFSKNYVVKNGKGIFDIQGQEHLGSAFLFNKNLMTTVFHEYSGSIIHWFINSPTKRFRSIGTHFQSIGKTSINSRNIDAAISPVLDLFENGDYLVTIRVFTDDMDFQVLGEQENYGIYVWLYYPNAHTIVQTLPREQMRPRRIAFWRRQILARKRPCVILAKSTDLDGFNCYFLIDGHHRMSAYLEEKVPPRAIIIEKLNPSKISSIAIDKINIRGLCKNSDTIINQLTSS